MQRHRLRVRVRPQGRGRRIYDLTVLWRVGETVLHNVDKKTLAGFMYEKHSTRAREGRRGGGNLAARIGRAFEFLAACALHTKVLLRAAINASDIRRELLERERTRRLARPARNRFVVAF